MLDADIRLRLDRLDLDAVLSVQAGEVVALLGPNGAGKSTILRALSGLLRLDGGKVELNGTVLEEPAKHIRAGAEQRRGGCCCSGSRWQRSTCPPRRTCAASSARRCASCRRQT